MSENFEAEKSEIADAYLDRSEKDEILALATTINPLRQQAKKDLLDKKDKGILSKIGEWIKQVAFKNVANQLDIKPVEYNTIELRLLKDLLKKAETKQQLDDLKQQVSSGKNIADIVLATDTKQSQSTDVSSTSSWWSISSSSSSEVLVVAWVATVLSPELQKVREHIEIKKSFANIKKVRNLDGKVILECTANTPYINVKALDDVIGLADAFFKKTGQPLSLNSVYRTIDHQKRLKKKNTVPTAEPGKSGHNLGLSMDINDGDRYEKAIGGIQGFRDLAKQYHFNPIKSEDWHFDHDSLPKSDERLAVAQSMDKEFQDGRLAA